MSVTEISPEKYMEGNVNLKNVVQCLVEDNLSEKLCLICLSPLDEFSENIFTEICKEDRQYSIAIVLENVCGITLCQTDNYCICSDCFITASSAYKFYLTCQRSQEILNFYINELDSDLNFLNLPDEQLQNLGNVCISLPIIEKSNVVFEYSLEGLALEKTSADDDICSQGSEEPEVTENDDPKNNIVKTESGNQSSITVKQEADETDDCIIIVSDESGKTQFYRQEENGVLTEVRNEEKKSYDIAFRYSVAGQDLLKNERETNPVAVKKERKKRSPMEFKKCSLCPVKYRFTAKLKEHMFQAHKMSLHICKICKYTTEIEQDYDNHLQMHTDVYICSRCGVSFKKRTTMIKHLKAHEERNRVGEGAHVCEVCGQILPSDDDLKDHCSKKHDKKFTCFYCGRMYKMEINFEAHIKKHESYLKTDDHKKYQCKQCLAGFSYSYCLERHIDCEHKNLKQFQCDQCDKKFKTHLQLNSHIKTHESDFSCKTCDRKFVDGRALLWHQRLHTNERPFPCDICGRAFVSANRRNSHALCAHTAPTRRCPLCPALFHLRSMVNSHIKKVHLNTHKRRNRSNKYQEVFWRTEPVPIQELSISIQNDLLELKTSNGHCPDQEFLNNVAQLS